MWTLLFLACAGADDSDGLDDSDVEVPACEALTAGDDWAWHGECPQMTTPVVLAVDGCAVALDYEPVGGMTMGMPYAGTVDGDTITFADDNTVDGCVGTVLSADEVSGSCAGGCTFTLER